MDTVDTLCMWSIEGRVARVKRLRDRTMHLPASWQVSPLLKALKDADGQWLPEVVVKASAIGPCIRETLWSLYGAMLGTSRRDYEKVYYVNGKETFRHYSHSERTADLREAAPAVLHWGPFQQTVGRALRRALLDEDRRLFEGVQSIALSPDHEQKQAAEDLLAAFGCNPCASLLTGAEVALHEKVVAETEQAVTMNRRCVWGILALLLVSIPVALPLTMAAVDEGSVDCNWVLVFLPWAVSISLSVGSPLLWTLFWVRRRVMSPGRNVAALALAFRLAGPRTVVGLLIPAFLSRAHLLGRAGDSIDRLAAIASAPRNWYRVPAAELLKAMGKEGYIVAGSPSPST